MYFIYSFSQKQVKWLLAYFSAKINEIYEPNTGRHIWNTFLQANISEVLENTMVMFSLSICIFKSKSTLCCVTRKHLWLIANKSLEQYIIVFSVRWSYQKKSIKLINFSVDCFRYKYKSNVYNILMGNMSFRFPWDSEANASES